MINRYFAALSVFLLCVLMFTACGSEPAVDGAMTPVKDSDGRITGYERRYHNDNGDITRWDVYTADEVYDHYVLYEYDDDGRLIQETTYKANGIGDYYDAYEYDDDGNLSAKTHYTAYDGGVLTRYDADGNETERLTYDNDDQLIKYEILTDGVWVEATEGATEASE